MKEIAHLKASEQRAMEQVLTKCLVNAKLLLS